MAEPELSRREIAARMSNPLSEIAPDVMFDMPCGEFISRIVDRERFVSKPLVEVETHDREDLPRHWRFLVPSRKHPRALTPVEFGLSGEDVTGMSTAESRFAHELAVDEDLKLNLGKQAVRGLYEAVGGDVVMRVNLEGDPLFAGIERRYRRGTSESSPTLAWSQLVYSKELLKTTHFMQKLVERMHRFDAQIPLWMHEASRIENRRTVADLMALSALVRTLEV